ncbi:uncharacterized protein LOC132269944 [Cornus florida]|uniref:uncharacterized protein LOC132269944 n=1 Tax=Cornus florida TaxID=4283 RepID=UPI00289744B6|nr:uncharacterized protein LOC132269944 [Cornus florida]
MFLQSFQEKSFPMPRDAECRGDGVLEYTSSGITLFCNKKQAAEAGTSRPLSGLPNMNVLPWKNSSSFQTGSAQSTQRAFQSEPVRIFDLDGRNTQSFGAGNLNVERNPKYGDMFSVSISKLHTINDPLSCPNRAGIGNANQVKSSENEMSIAFKHSYMWGDISRGTTYNKSANNIFSGPTCSKGDESITPWKPAINNANANFISTGNANNGDGSFVLMGRKFNKIGDTVISMPLVKGDGNIISTDPAFNKGFENVVLMDPSHNNAHQNFISMGYTSNNNVISTGPTPDKADTSVLPMHTNYDKGSSSMQSMGRKYNRSPKNATIIFGGCQDKPDTNPSGRTNRYDLLTSQPRQKALVVCNNDAIVNVAPSGTSRTRAVPKRVRKRPNRPNKPSQNEFPSHVKSLLTTGIFDGVPVNYYNWTRQNSLKGVIKGTGYLCGCNNCKYSKILNAFEFEHHAGYKTKHPNDHIYFFNGKTIYAVVQELRATPKDMLFEAIRNVTGSPIHEKNFRIWKESYQAATRELQRIYGKEKVTKPTE